METVVVRFMGAVHVCSNKHTHFSIDSKGPRTYTSVLTVRGPYIHFSIDSKGPIHTLQY